jgi:IS30 family transposase
MEGAIEKESQPPKTHTFLNNHEEDEMSYRQLTVDDRYQIQILGTEKFTPTEIAERLGFHRSTIVRELKRNSEPAMLHAYTAKRAQKKTRQRRVDKGKRSRKLQGSLQAIVEALLRRSWSPEAIAGRLRLEQKITISHETIYQHVIRDSKAMGYLRYCLRFGGYKHHRFKKSTVAAKTALRKKTIHDRPASVNNRRVLGHWERDTLLGQRGRSALLTLIERKSRLSRIRRIANVDVEHASTGTVGALKGLGAKSVTNDNGTEFQRDDELQNKMQIPIYFCDPKSPWQRGSIENLNGLIRQYIPKGSDIDALPDAICDALEETLNFRPRKTLGFRTPHEVFYRENLKLTTDPSAHLGLEFSRST